MYNLETITQSEYDNKLDKIFSQHKKNEKYIAHYSDLSHSNTDFTYIMILKKGLNFIKNNKDNICEYDVIHPYADINYNYTYADVFNRYFNNKY